MATPHVSGTVALMLENNPALTSLKVKQTLESTAVDLGTTGKDKDYGAGRIDAYKAVFGTQKRVSDFSATLTSGNMPLSVSFADTSSGSPNKWSWNFGDSTTSTIQNPTHTYTKAGTYSVKLTVSNSAGSNTITKNNYITVTAPPRPVAAFSGSPTSGYMPLNVAFTDTSSQSPNKWSWSFGDGQTSTQQNPTHTYSKAGRYTVSLTASNAAGSNLVSKSSYVSVVAPPRVPVAAFSGSSTSGRIPLSVSFTDRSTNTPTLWNWDFGDGTSSTAKNPDIHTVRQAHIQ